jgi:hypothetical protein
MFSNNLEIEACILVAEFEYSSAYFLAYISVLVLGFGR